MARRLAKLTKYRHKPPRKGEQPDERDEPPTSERREAGGVYTVRIEPNSKDEDWKAEQRKNWARQLCVAKWLNAITLIASVVALAGLIFLYGTLNATKEAADATRDAVDAQLRPFLHIEHIRGGSETPILVPSLYDSDLAPGEAGPPAPEFKREVKFVVKNYGHGMAFQVYVEAYWQSYEEDTQGAPIELDPFKASGHRNNHSMNTRIAKRILAANDEAEGTGEAPSALASFVFGPIRAVSIDDLKSGGLEIFGWVWHCDVLRVPRYDAFCFVLYPLMSPPMHSPIVPCPWVPRAMKDGPWRGRGSNFTGCG